MVSNKVILVFFTLCAHVIYSQEGSGDRSLFPTFTQCNYTAEPGWSCANCRQVLECNSNNVGILKNCYFLKRFCNNGRCSFLPGTGECFATTTVAATTTEVITTTGSVTTQIYNAKLAAGEKDVAVEVMKEGL